MMSCNYRSHMCNQVEVSFQVADPNWHTSAGNSERLLARIWLDTHPPSAWMPQPSQLQPTASRAAVLPLQRDLQSILEMKGWCREQPMTVRRTRVIKLQMYATKGAHFLSLALRQLLGQKPCRTSKRQNDPAG